MSDFKIGSKVILVNSGMEGTIIDSNMNNPFPYKVSTPIGELFAGRYAMKLKRLNDATPEEHDAVNYYKKLDERLPDDFWDGEPDPSVVKDDNWDEERVDAIGQNGNTGEHYQVRTPEEIAKSVSDTQKFIDSLKERVASNKTQETVSNPKHYQILDKEVIDYIYNSLSAEEFRGYCMGNIMKYRLRAGKKGDALEDLAKANEYEKIWERYYGAD